MKILRHAGLMLTLILASCDSVQSTTGEQDPLEQHDWLAVSIAGAAVPNPERVTLSIANGRVFGRGGCNQYSGPVEYGNGRIKIGPIISTEMACVEGGLMQLESKYLGALQSADGYEFTSRTLLTITTAGGPLLYAASPKQLRP